MTKTSDQTIRLKDIEVFARPNCKIKNPERVERLLNEIINGGTELLQVVTDYDFTLTKQKTNDGRPVMSSFGMFNQCKSLPSAYVAGSNQLYEKYRPIEICPKMTQEEKEPHMIEWWDLSNKLLKGISFNPTEIEDLVKEYGPTLRDGTQQMLKLTNESSIPVLVFSAGLGDSILAVLRHEQVMYSNVKIVSNFLKYENGIVNGFSDNNPIIHTFNKNETVLEGTEYFEMVQNRKNVILMGDSLADADMAKGVPNTSSVLKIGFLFDHPEKNLPKYQDQFDIVLIDDQTMDIPHKILSLATLQISQQDFYTKDI